MYQIDYFKLLMLHHKLHEFLLTNKIIETLIGMLQIHDDMHIVKAISSALSSDSTNALFFPNLLSDKNL